MTELIRLDQPARPPAARPWSVADGQRAMMSGFPTGVAVLTTTGQDGTPHGMTISSVCSVSLDPPLLLVCLRIGSPTLRAVLDTGRFAVNLLRSGGAGTRARVSSPSVTAFIASTGSTVSVCTSTDGRHAVIASLRVGGVHSTFPTRRISMLWAAA
ncbi:flavin reductase family protein [Streptomyces sp. NPDC056373]|uniref:flavin reductase family protein n=1 Tax=Streptomyces sp. NPDC056373 TaxID=3345798 RepID=UPI0035DA5856